MSTVAFDELPTLDSASVASTATFARWRGDLRTLVLGEIGAFLRGAGVEDLLPVKVDDILWQYAAGGKGLRSTFLYLGWLCGAEPAAAAVRAAASLELLHGFALLQDDVMDNAVLRRGAPAAHVVLTTRHGARADSRFGTAAATLLGDMCLVWAEQMMRESGLDTAALERMWPRYDAMRIELAAGQFADLSNDVRACPPLSAVLDTARAKSGNYTVRRPLELGAALAGCEPRTLHVLGAYGSRVGEAFQLRDDLLGIFGSEALTGKPQDCDLGEHKATSVVVVALDCAGPAARRELSELLARPVLDVPAIERCRTLIAECGAPQRIEAMIDARVEVALNLLDTGPLDAVRRAALRQLALLCTAGPA
ncbi:polyprenyl synthetase family protein [Nocardia sp. NPDC050712]|uniref:polyprenyl synthetase family protein n=1 Tax=Nocardia sp. NPDC050712 TaxID=3155518 RepID=UPI0033C58E72